jgi:hypothetical protein
MNHIERAATLAELAENLRAHGSWCGETHLQKAVFFLETLFAVPLGFDFVIYKHGPFSFELRDELTALRAENVLDIQAQPPPYRPSLILTPLGERLRRQCQSAIAPHQSAIDAVAARLGCKGVAELEKLATALFVRCREEVSGDAGVERLCSLKPHIPRDEAATAFAHVDEMLSERASW